MTWAQFATGAAIGLVWGALMEIFCLRRAVSAAVSKERLRLQPQLDALDRARDVELEAVLDHAHKMAVDHAERHGKYSPTLLRFIRALDCKEHRNG